METHCGRHSRAGCRRQSRRRKRTYLRRRERQSYVSLLASLRAPPATDHYALSEYTCRRSLEAPMEFRFTPEEEAFRREIRAFLSAELPGDWGQQAGVGALGEGGDARWEFLRQFQKKLA